MRLDAQERLGIADVRPQRFGHLGDRLEESRVDLPQVLDDRILVIHDVVSDRSVVCVGDDLHAVANVVEMTTGDRCRAEAERGEVLAVGVASARREGIVDPVELAVRDDQIRVGVVLEEGRDQPLARDDRSMEQQPAVGGDLVRHEEVREIAEPQREQDAVPQGTDPDATGAAELRAHVALNSRVIEFRLVRVDDDVVARELAEVDPGLVDLGFANRRDVADRKERLARAVDGSDRRRHGSEPVREDEVPVEPALRWKAVGRELARGEKDGRFLTAYLVAIDVHVVERVVLAEPLQLRERGQQRAVIPQPDGRDVR